MDNPPLHFMWNLPFMRKRLRTALVCLLMLAVPVQAMAAFGMRLCQQVHGHGLSHLMVDHGDRHGPMMQAVDLKPGMHHPVQSASCYLCAFCLSAALLDQPFVPAGQPLRSEPPQTLSEGFVSLVPETPERPPRLSFS